MSRIADSASKSSRKELGTGCPGPVKPAGENLLRRVKSTIRDMIPVSRPFDPQTGRFGRADHGRRPAANDLASHTRRANSYGMKMTLDIDQQKVEEAMAQYGVGTKTEVIDLALKELLRKKAVERLMGSFGQLPHLPTNEELERPEKRRLGHARRR